MNRDGSPKNNPNSGGTGAGSYQSTTTPVFTLSMRGFCTVGESEGDDDGSLNTVVVQTDLSYIPC
jgi:hypothetical protein